MLAKEKAARITELPIFYKMIGSYEVFYLQVPPNTERREALNVKAWLEKGIDRLQNDCNMEAGADRAYVVYDGSFEKWLQEKVMADYWQALWGLAPYREYTQPHNLMLLLQNLSGVNCPGKWIVIGDVPGVSDWIHKLARYMTSITFFSKNPPAEWERMQAHLQQEFGLLTEWKRTMHPASAEPAMVLDYCTKERLFIWDVCRRSIWIDMNSLESRRHDIQDRDTGMHYYSLKRFWKEEMIQTLDTANKIKYNT